MYWNKLLETGFVLFLNHDCFIDIYIKIKLKRLAKKPSKVYQIWNNCEYFVLKLITKGVFMGTYLDKNGQNGTHLKYM